MLDAQVLSPFRISVVRGTIEAEQARDTYRLEKAVQNSRTAKDKSLDRIQENLLRLLLRVVS